MPAITCQYGSCLEEVGDQGIVVSLKAETFDGEKRAIYCCASHASAALHRLAMERKENYWPADTPRRWRQT